jgi:hypothetical protein
MSTVGNFTPDEWKVLSDTPVVVGKAMITTSHAGLVGSVEEVRTLTSSLQDLTKQKSSNPLLNALGNELQNKVNFIKDLGNTITEEFRSITKKPATTDTRALALEAANDAASILSKASPEDAQAYKQFVLSTAQKVAQAAREGGLVRFSGDKISPDEQKLLDDLKVALHVNA